MSTKEEAKAALEKLVARFHEQYDSYKRSDYSEALVRKDFIDPFFRLLGWDMDNSQGYAEAYREVIHEDKVRVAGAMKAPDYSFRLPGGKRLFFVEAKKPSVKVKTDVMPAYQVRRYAWSAKLPVSILTDFEEFSVYDCTQKPEVKDSASKARMKYLTYDQYIKEFDFLWETFSKEQVLKGSFDRYLKSDKHKRGTSTVDKAFLESLDSWRTYLATSISLRNKQLDEEGINFVVQHIIDRLIFLRIAEDRGVEPYGQLKAILKEKGDHYPKLFDIFQHADRRYNSGLFDFKKDELSETLTVDNKVMKTIIEELYYPASPYEFSVISVEILGSAYEQFLGKQIRIDSGHRARIEKKPEVRHAGGVYYTPQYIVEYIVQHTVGELVKGKKPSEVADLRIVDPACGSGSFLLGAYDHLLNWHKQQYGAMKKLRTGKKSDKLRPDGELTTAEKKRILVNNIFGVDLDANAVEVTKLSLLLKCMEGETEASINQQLGLFHDRVLPTLDRNIQCGNSLIAPDWYDLFPDGDARSVRPFDWKRSFPAVFKQGGFDAVIGNPPYVLLQNINEIDFFTYATNHYLTAKYKIDTYQLFIERSVHLTRTGGLLGYITPNTFLKNIHAEPLRRFILENTKLSEILLFDYNVFDQASVDTCVFILAKTTSSAKHSFKVFRVAEAFKPRALEPVLQRSLILNERADFALDVSSSDKRLLEKIRAGSRPLGDSCGAYFGIQAWDRKKHVAERRISKHYVPVIDGSDIEPYGLRSQTLFTLFTPEGVKSGGNRTIHEQQRICIRQVGHFPIAAIVPGGLYAMNSLYNVYRDSPEAENLYYILGIMNSWLTRYYWSKVHSDQKKTFPKVKKSALLDIQLKVARTANELALRERIAKIARQLTEFKDSQFLQQGRGMNEDMKVKVEHFENRINEAVFELYNLTAEEIRVVMDALK
ncbi:MAG: N-6 DNA methylase [Flavobacteriales bacterium]|nr:N-6 DNA methylase [Flavobacteriales bacterium]